MMISVAALALMMASAAVYATGQRKTLTRLLHRGVSCGSLSCSGEVSGRKHPFSSLDQLCDRYHRRRNDTLYVGTTADLARRVWEHREGAADGFTRRYGLKCLVYAEEHNDILAAKQRELNIKHWPRAWKVRLIHQDNPDRNDLYDRLL